MSKYTAEQARSSLQKMHGHPLTVAERAELFSMASNYADLLCERESAKAGVTERCPHGVRYPHPCRECEDSAPMHDDLYRAALAVSARIFRWRTEGAQPTYSEWMELEEKIDQAISSYTPKAVAPMLASARVPDEKEDLDPVRLRREGRVATEWERGFNEGWNDCRDAVLAAAPKPEKE